MIINQVNKFLCKRNFLQLVSRYVHHDSSLSKRILHPLESRKLLRVSGDEVSVFLQGLTTNDMGHFEEGAKSVYTMFLNNKGRVLYETLIYKTDEETSFLIECDGTIINLLQKHLKMFKLKRKIDIQDMNQERRLWALTTLNNTSDSDIPTSEDINVYRDPRLVNLGFRVIAPSSFEGPEVAKIFGTDISVYQNEDEYKYLRYQLGVSEGTNDLPPGSSFPLEANCDYLHGVSFHKGCYIGQEVTARVHHTGVVRKRLMPLKFSETINESIEPDTKILAIGNPKSNLGKFKGLIKNYGLGLIRIKEAMEAESLTIGKYRAEIIKPSWWPIEAPKENIAKSD